METYLQNYKNKHTVIQDICTQQKYPSRIKVKKLLDKEKLKELINSILSLKEIIKEFSRILDLRDTRRTEEKKIGMR